MSDEDNDASTVFADDGEDDGEESGARLLLPIRTHQTTCWFDCFLCLEHGLCLEDAVQHHIEVEGTSAICIQRPHGFWLVPYEYRMYLCGTTNSTHTAPIRHPLNCALVDREFWERFRKNYFPTKL